MRVLLSIICISICFASCSDENTTQSVVDPYDRWRSFNIHNYTIDQTVYCFCENSDQTVRLTIISDTIASAIRISDSVNLPYSRYSLYQSIESLFTKIKNSEDSLVVQYNEKYGFPEILDINPHLHPVDGGVLFETVNLHF